jgi:uncharacterized protein (TIGR03643 family)
MNQSDRDAVVQLAWADQISFEEIKSKTGLTEAKVIRLMRTELKRSSFKRWRTRVTDRPAKHRKMLLCRKRAAQRRSSEYWLSQAVDTIL